MCTTVHLCGGAIIGACRNSCLLIMHKTSSSTTTTTTTSCTIAVTFDHRTRVIIVKWHAPHLSRPRKLISCSSSSTVVIRVRKGEHCLTFSYLTRVGNSCSPREYLVSLTYINTEPALEHGSRTRRDWSGVNRFYFHPLRDNLKNFFFLISIW